MRWLRRHPEQAKLAEQARSLRERADRELAEAEERAPKFHSLADRLRELREANGLREAFEATFREGHS